MVSFQHKLVDGLNRRGIQTCFELDEARIDAVLVTGGTRRLDILQRARRRGIRIVQRLDGMNWIHRQQPTGVRHWLRAEWGNWLLALIRSRFADHIVYQSHFSQSWWEREYGETPVSSSVIYNGVDLDVFHPSGAGQQPQAACRVLLVEGSLMGGYEHGLHVAFALAEGLSAHLTPVLRQRYPQGIELMVAGRVSNELRSRYASPNDFTMHWAGLLPGHEIPKLDRSAHLLYSADLNAACPNSVIEALACGLPVLAFDTGALPELVQDGAGLVAAYGGNPWKLEKPDLAALIQAALTILEDWPGFATRARQRAEVVFGLDAMVDAYGKSLLEKN